MIFLEIVIVIVFLMCLGFFLLNISRVEIEFKKFDFISNDKSKILEDYLIYVRLKIFNKITWIKFKINDKKVTKIKKSKFVNKRMIQIFDIWKNIILENIKDILKRRNVEHIRNLDIKLRKLDLNIKLNVVDKILTSLVVVAISTAISILLARNVKEYNSKECKYVIKPTYSEKPEIIIKLSCIINVKMVHIINIVYMLFKRRSVDYVERTSNRRTYVFRNE